MVRLPPFSHYDQGRLPKSQICGVVLEYQPARVKVQAVAWAAWPDAIGPVFQNSATNGWGLRFPCRTKHLNMIIYMTTTIRHPHDEAHFVT